MTRGRAEREAERQAKQAAWEAEQNRPVSIVLEGDTIVVTFGYRAERVADVKHIPGRRFHPDDKSWRMPLRPEALEPLQTFATAHDAVIPDAILAPLSHAKEQAQVLVQASKAEDADLRIDGLGGELRPFQRAGVVYAAHRERCLIGDSMGLGKTPQALATLLYTAAFPAVIVCPASLKLNWQREARKWLPTKTVEVWQGSRHNYSADVVILNYDILGKHLARLQRLQPQGVVFDESQYLKNRKAARSQHALALAQAVRIRLCLSGTPLLNRPIELAHQLAVLGRLEDLGGFWTFARRYCGAHRSEWGWDFSGAHYLEELNTRLRETCLVRRLKADVLTELPAKQRVTLPIALTNRRDYERAERNLIAWLQERALAEEAFQAEIAGLPPEEQQHRAHERVQDVEWKTQQAEQLVRIEALKKIAADGKRKEATQWVTDFIESEKLVLFVWHRDYAKHFAHAFHCPVITGDTPLQKRQEAVDRFQNDEECRLIVLNLEAGGVGLTLTAASNVAFFELGWTPALHDQAEDRCHRIGQHSHVTAWYLLAERTIEETIALLIEQKRAVVETVVDGKVSGARGIALVNELTEELLNG